MTSVNEARNVMHALCTWSHLLKKKIKSRIAETQVSKCLGTCFILDGYLMSMMGFSNSCPGCCVRNASFILDTYTAFPLPHAQFLKQQDVVCVYLNLF